MADTHSVMPKKLAHALMEAGVQHFDGGGIIGGLSDILGVTNNFQAQAPSISNQNFAPQITEQQKRQTDVYNQQQGLAQALLSQSQGQGGPSPAQAMLAQQTGNNAAQQGALMASQRGAGANPALIARLAAQQGAQAQQMGVGQAATLRAQEQLAAQQALAQQQQAMAGNALQGESIQQGGAAAQNSAAMGGQGINAQVAAGNQSAGAGLLGGILQGAGAAFGLAKGGEVPHMANGGLMGIQDYGSALNIPQFTPSFSGGESLSKGMGGLGKALKSKSPWEQSDADALSGYAKANQMFGSGPSMMMPTGGGLADLAMMAAQGGDVPGEAEVKGNSEENDKVPALLSPGEIVLPRSVTQAPDMEKKAIEFLRHLKSNKKGYDKVADSRKAKMNCGGYVR